MAYKIIESIQDIGEFLSSLATVNEVSLDVETSSLDPLTCKLYSLQIGINKDIFIFNLLKFTDLKYIVDLLTNKVCIGHNIKYDIEVLYVHTKIMLNKVYDTMLAEVLIAKDPTNRYYSLNDLTTKYCNTSLDKSVRETFYSNGVLTELTEQQFIYMAEDVQYLSRIKEAQEKEITASRQDKVWELECEVEPIVAKMEITGVAMDKESWLALAEKSKRESVEVKSKTIELLIERLKQLSFNNLLELADALKIPVKTKRDRAALVQITDKDYYDSYIRKNFNLASPTQLLKALNIVGINLESTGAKVLDELHSDDPIINSISEYREKDKLVGSFGQKFIDAISPVDDRLHYQLNQLGTRTGRFSGGGDGINMQQIPREAEYRNCFIAEPGWKLICYDFNQQEYRLAGAVTYEPRIIQSYVDGMDMHTATASLIYNIPMKEVTKQQRSVAKSFNFAILYGSTEHGLAYNFKISVAEGKEILNKFYTGYPVYKKAKEMYEEAIVKAGFALTVLGRRRYFPKPQVFETSEDYKKYVSSTKREGFNMIIQGSGADITKLSMLEMVKNNPFGYENFIPILQVHDEIVAKVVDKYADEASEFMKNCMERVEQRFLGDIPAKVEGGVKTKWEH